MKTADDIMSISKSVSEAITKELEKHKPIDSVSMVSILMFTIMGIEMTIDLVQARATGKEAKTINFLLNKEKEVTK